VRLVGSFNIKCSALDLIRPELDIFGKRIISFRLFLAKESSLSAHPMRIALNFGFGRDDRMMVLLYSFVLAAPPYGVASQTAGTLVVIRLL